MALAGRVCTSCATPIPGSERTCPSCGAISLPGLTGSLGDAVAERLRAALGQRYRIERELGEGGMAVVFLAHDLKHDRQVAVKVLRPELAAFLGGERFLREIHIAAQLNHAHILPLHDSGDADGLLFYVMPYVEGDSLRGRLARQGPLPLEEAVRIASEVADGLAYAHDLGVIHRDIKPENILLSHGHAAIADFGIARAVAGAGAGSSLTTAGVSLGTPSYMSPEQANGDPALDHRADIYSLGCTLYEMLTGRPPYPGPTPQALVLQHLTEPVPAARATRREVPVPLDEAVRRAMAKTAADRFQTAAEFRAALGVVPAATGAPAPPLPHTTHRRRRALILAGILVAVVVVVAGVAGLVLRRSQVPVQPGARAPLRVVVRPFEDRTGGLRPTADRITEALTDLLQPVPALAVTANAVVAELGNASLDTLRARFAPDRIVIGHVEEAGMRLRVSVQIVDPRTGRSLADSELTVPRSAGAAAAVAGPLSVFVRHAFWADLERDARRARVREATAWTLVERARELSDAAERALTERLDRQGFRSLDVADSLLREAQKADGASDLIPIELAHTADLRAFAVEYLIQVLKNPPADLPSPAAERARALAILDRMIRDRRGPADAFELRGRVKDGLYRATATDSLLDGAIADFRSATELDVHRAGAWRDLGAAYSSAGAYPDALLAFEHAFAEDGFQLYRADLLRYRFDAALLAERYAEAGEACSTGVAEMPDDVRFQDCEVKLWSRTRADWRSAALAWARSEALAAREPRSVFAVLRELWVAEILARAGLADSADHLARRATQGAPDVWNKWLFPELAYFRILRGDPDSALTLVGAAVRLDPVNRRYALSAPWYRSVRTDPRFARLAEGNSTPP